MTKPNPNARFYPAHRAVRVDRSKMTEAEWMEHKRQKDREKCARWNERHPGKSYDRLRNCRAENPWWAPLLAAGDRARKKNLEYNLTADWAKQTYIGVCELTAIPFHTRLQERGGKPGGRPYSPSIDRINPLKGYTQDNCRWVLFAVNSFKGTMTDQEMLTIARALITRAP